MIQGWKRLKWQKKKTPTSEKKWFVWFGGLNSAAPGMNIFNNIFIHSGVCGNGVKLRFGLSKN